MKNIFNDKDTYNILTKDPTKKLTISLCDMLNKWKNSSFISATTYRSLYCSDSVLPRAYGFQRCTS